MDYEIRIVVEKVAVSSQEVVQRDTITSYALQCPTSIVELGLRHGEQIALLAKIQDLLLTEHSPPYTFFLLNGDMELYRNRHLFV
jgi:hypothetical protein